MGRLARYGCLGACALALGAPAGAAAQSGGPVPPADAAVVAGPVAGITVLAFDHGGQLCIARKGQPSSCDAPPDAPWHPRYAISPGAFFGAVTADVATVEVRQPGRVQRVATTPGAYAGAFAGRVRFFIAAIAGPAPPYRLRMLDAQGRVVGAQDIGQAPALHGAATFARGHLGRSAWRATAFQRSTLAPTPLDRGRTERMTCLSVVLGPRPLTSEGCARPTRARDVLFTSTSPRCDAGATVLTGLAGAATTALQAVLGDGAHRRLALQALPARFGDPRRAFALVVGREVAIRSLLVRAQGRTRTVALGLAPAEVTCVRGAAVGSFGFFAIALGAAPAGSGGLVARDDGDDLCVGVGAIAPADCRLPPVELYETRIERRRAGTRTAVLIVAPPDVIGVRLRFDAGPLLTVPTSDLPGYAGKCRGFVRGVLVTVPGDRRVYAADLLGAGGRVLLHEPGPDERLLAHAPRLLARLPGGGTVAASDDCLQVRSGAPSRDRGDCLLGFRDLAVSAPCAARRAVVVARLRRPVHGLEVTTKAGATIRGRRHGAFAVAIVPARAAVRSIHRLGAASLTVAVPPAAQQCGYGTEVPIPRRF